MRVSLAWFLVLGIPLLSASNASGLKMIVRHSFDGISSDQTLYIEQDRKRTEYRNSVRGERRSDGSTAVRYGPRLASITRCDLARTIELNLDTGEYVAGSYPPEPLSKERREALKLPQLVASGEPTLRVETTTVNTGERKDFFGHTARHVLTTRKQVPLEGSRSDAQQTVTDGWYIDLDSTVSCGRKSRAGKVRTHAFLSAGNTPVEKIEFIDTGEPETGFAIERRTTSLSSITLPNGTKKDHASVSEMRVTEFVEGPLDPALFVIPTGFRQVEHIERNPSSNFPNQWSIAWYRFRESVARLFH